MPEVWYEVVFKDGKRAVKARALLNSGSSFVVLPSKLAQKLELKPAGKAEIELADGKVLEREVYEIEVEMKNEQTGERRSAKSLATVEERDYPLLGTEAMEKTPNYAGHS